MFLRQLGRLGGQALVLLDAFGGAGFDLIDYLQGPCRCFTEGGKNLYVRQAHSLLRADRRKGHRDQDLGPSCADSSGQQSLLVAGRLTTIKRKIWRARW